jgi:hypothetical protein
LVKARNGEISEWVGIKFWDDHIGGEIDGWHRAALTCRPPRLPVSRPQKLFHQHWAGDDDAGGEQCPFISLAVHYFGAGFLG